MSGIKKALDQHQAHIVTLRCLIVVLIGLLIYAIAGWTAAPAHIKIDIPPDLRTGSTRGIQERHPFNIYSFGLYIFQQLNNWPVNGIDDYHKQIAALGCYFTPRFKGELDRDFTRRNKQHELNRTRALQEVPDKPYEPNRIYKESGDSWVAYYDVNIKETFRAEIIKNIFVRYPIRVVRWDVDPECNLWGLALDGYFSEPTRLEQKTEVSAQQRTITGGVSDE